MDSTLVSQVRQFNRTVTERVGALNERFLGRDRPLGQARLLWEIGKEGRDVRRLRSQLGLDSGYVSRLLRSLQAEGLVTVEPQQDDKRVRNVRLTPAGRAERTLLDRSADDLAASLLQPLTDAQRTRLVTAMGDVERLLTAAIVTITPADPEHPDARHCMQQYAAELDRRFEHGFDTAQSNVARPGELRPPAGLLLVARLHSQPVGCGALKFKPDAPTQIKRMWVDESARGLGVGRRLLYELERHAAVHGTRVLHLETNRSLTAAISMYRSAGYTEVEAFNDEPYAHHWFEKHITPTPHEGL
ncbi:bifunctional helix-turn-helix transcriptional regulator/GNAT family N-acetyltransferase [Streptomyces albidus (ex Kaewkla and Franco 2022)]|uniref:bifunctional helix-turn-helix transcriptional regulator/GNAT family N-acetyltransferase n=1 Tax=Streptomyces albidus (ex Kaewkla and Franco 2022) TaxID=722709 RepID=UPI0015EE9D51|nr:helix-turn-helix domain-containing GNAT family N-acetyltransferase [Streptomyces albidus (ex Kaewkla and Franco 2022)]